MAISPVANGNSAANTGTSDALTSLGLTKPPAGVKDDYRILVAEMQNDISVTAPGWVLLAEAENPANNSFFRALGYRVPESGEPSTHTFTFSGASGGALACHTYGGVAPGNEMDVPPTTAAVQHGAPYYSPAITPITNGAFIVRCFGRSHVGGTPDITAPTGHTLRSSASCYGPDAIGQAAGIADIGSPISPASAQPAVDWGGFGAYWSGISLALRPIPPDTTPPAAPTGLTATLSGSSDALLDWADNTETDLSHYNVYRSTTSGGPYTKLNASNITSSTYTNAGLSAGTTYYYVVRAVDTNGNESSNSSQISFSTTVQVSGGGNFTKRAIGGGSVVLVAPAVSGGTSTTRRATGGGSVSTETQNAIGGDSLARTVPGDGVAESVDQAVSGGSTETRRSAGGGSVVAATLVLTDGGSADRRISGDGSVAQLSQDITSSGQEGVTRRAAGGGTAALTSINLTDGITTSRHTPGGGEVLSGYVLEGDGGATRRVGGGGAFSIESQGLSGGGSVGKSSAGGGSAALAPIGVSGGVFISRREGGSGSPSLEVHLISGGGSTTKTQSGDGTVQSGVALLINGGTTVSRREIGGGSILALTIPLTGPGGITRRGNGSGSILLVRYAEASMDLLSSLEARPIGIKYGLVNLRSGGDISVLSSKRKVATSRPILFEFTGDARPSKARAVPNLTLYFTLHIGVNEVIKRHYARAVLSSSLTISPPVTPRDPRLVGRAGLGAVVSEHMT